MTILSTLRHLALVATLAATAISAHAGDLVPIKGGTAGQVISKTYIADPNTSPLGTPFLVAVSEGVGHATHLGKHTTAYEEVFRLEIIDGKLLVVSDGTFVTTTANGDQLFGTYTNFRGNGELAFTGVSEFTGGTGRFEGASGAKTMEGELEPDLMHFSYTHDGVMTSVGSLRGKGK